MAYGRDHTRFEENKRAVDDKFMGPLVNTVMTRCIQCTRCVRFITEVAGVQEIGLASRGEDAEITTYLEESLTSELSGNVIDLCPVGALTSKPYAFNARPWELVGVESVDVMDAVGSNIRVDARSGRVLRILPVINEDINEEWISDKTRFVWDGLSRQRLDQPFIRKNGKLAPASWDEALALAAEKLSGDPEKIAAIAGDLCDAEAMKALKDLMDGLGAKSLECRQDGAKIGNANRSAYLFNTTIMGVEEADAILLVGTNPRLEAPLVNTRIRKTWIEGNLNIGVIGEAADLTYDYDHIGNSPDEIAKLSKSNKGFAKVLKSAKNPLIIIGAGALARQDGAQILRACGELAKSFGIGRQGWNVLHSVASRVAGLDIGFVPGEGGSDMDGIISGGFETVYLLGADEFDTNKLKNSFVIYQGSHGDRGAHVADVILPSAAYTENDGLYTNTEGRVQMGFAAVAPKGDAKPGWAIVRALSGHMKRELPYDNLEQLREKLMADHPAFSGVNYIAEPAEDYVFDPASFGEAGKVSSAPFKCPIEDFYMTNPIARSSKVMAECSEVAASAQVKEAAE